MHRFENRFQTAVLALAAVLTFSAAASADVLVTTEGERIETKGPWKVKGRQIIFTDTEGRLVALRARDVDLEASEQATREAEAPPPPPAARAAAVEEPAPEPVLVLTNASLRASGGGGGANLANVTEPGTVRAFMNVYAAGYRLTVRVNGQQVQIGDIPSGGFQIFHVNHPNKAITEAAIAERGEIEGLTKELSHFCLVEGANQLEMEWEATGSTMAPISFELRASNYSVPLLKYEHEDQSSGSLSTSFEIFDAMPDGFETKNPE